MRGLKGMRERELKTMWRIWRQRRKTGKGRGNKRNRRKRSGRRRRMMRRRRRRWRRRLLRRSQLHHDKRGDAGIHPLASTVQLQKTAPTTRW